MGNFFSSKKNSQETPSSAKQSQGSSRHQDVTAFDQTAPYRSGAGASDNSQHDTMSVKSRTKLSEKPVTQSLQPTPSTPAEPPNSNAISLVQQQQPTAPETTSDTQTEFSQDPSSYRVAEGYAIGWIENSHAQAGNNQYLNVATFESAEMPLAPMSLMTVTYAGIPECLGRLRAAHAYIQSSLMPAWIDAMEDECESNNRFRNDSSGADFSLWLARTVHCLVSVCQFYAATKEKEFRNQVPWATQSTETVGLLPEVFAQHSIQEIYGVEIDNKMSDTLTDDLMQLFEKKRKWVQNNLSDKERGLCKNILTITYYMEVLMRVSLPRQHFGLQSVGRTVPFVNDAHIDLNSQRPPPSFSLVRTIYPSLCYVANSEVLLRAFVFRHTE